MTHSASRPRLCRIDYTIAGIGLGLPEVYRQLGAKFTGQSEDQYSGFSQF